MAEGRRRDQWDHTASLMALIATCHRDPKKRRSGFVPSEFHPFHAGGGAAKGTRLYRGNLALLKTFVDPKMLQAFERQKEQARLCPPNSASACK